MNRNNAHQNHKRLNKAESSAAPIFNIYAAAFYKVKVSELLERVRRIVPFLQGEGGDGFW